MYRGNNQVRPTRPQNSGIRTGQPQIGFNNDGSNDLEMPQYPFPLSGFASNKPSVYGHNYVSLAPLPQYNQVRYGGQPVQQFQIPPQTQGYPSQTIGELPFNSYGNNGRFGGYHHGQDYVPQQPIPDYYSEYGHLGHGGIGMQFNQFETPSRKSSDFKMPHPCNNRNANIVKQEVYSSGKVAQVVPTVGNDRKHVAPVVVHKDDKKKPKLEGKYEKPKLTLTSDIDGLYKMNAYRDSFEMLFDVYGYFILLTSSFALSDLLKYLNL